MAPARSRLFGFPEVAAVLAALYFAARPTGPASVLLLGALFIHCSFGEPRAAFFPLYLVGFPVAVQGFRLDGFVPHVQRAAAAQAQGSPDGPQAAGLDASPPADDAGFSYVLAARIALLAAPLLVLVFESALCPTRGRCLAPSGTMDVAMQEVGFPGGGSVRLYFPARVDKKNAQLVPYFLHGRATVDGTAGFLGIPSFLLRWLVHTRPWCYDADPDWAVPVPGPGTFPVVVFSHGLGGTPDCYASTIRDLASRGFLVAAVHHADGSAAYVRHDDGYERP
jgi:hypothetical protein